MKIHELLTENEVVNSELLDESLLSTLFGGLAKSTARGIRKAKVAWRKATRPKFPTAAEKQFAKDMAEIKEALGIFATGTKHLLMFLSTIGLGGPFLYYYNNMVEYKAMLESGEINQAQYDEGQREQLGTLITSVTAGLAGHAILSTMSGILKIFTFFSPSLSKLLTGVAVSGHVAITAAINSYEGRKLIGEMLGTRLIEGTGDVSNKLYNYFEKLITDAVGEVTSAVTGATAAGAAAGTPTASNVEAPDLKKFRSSASTSATTAGAAAGTPDASTSDPISYIANRFVRDPKTGQLKLNI